MRKLSSLPVEARAAITCLASIMGFMLAFCIPSIPGVAEGSALANSAMVTGLMFFIQTNISLGSLFTYIVSSFTLDWLFGTFHAINRSGFVLWVIILGVFQVNLLVTALAIIVLGLVMHSITKNISTIKLSYADMQEWRAQRAEKKGQQLMEEALLSDLNNSFLDANSSQSK